MIGTIEQGSRQAVDYFARVQEDERVVVIMDRDATHIGHALASAAQEVTRNVFPFVMEDYGERGDPRNPLTLPKDIQSALRQTDVSFYAAKHMYHGEVDSFRTPLIETVVAHRIRHGHMPGITEQIMCTGVCADYDDISALTDRIVAAMKGVQRLKVFTSAGTEMLITLSPNYTWVHSAGRITRTHWSNIPAGEAFTCAAGAEGTLVIDGLLGSHLEQYGILNQTPVTVYLSGGRVKAVECDNPEIVEDLRRSIARYENGDRVGEVAIGTNTALYDVGLVGRMLQDEKFPGLHAAFGHGYPEETGAEWTSRGHIDAVIQHVTLYADGRKIMEDSRFLL